MKRDEKFWEEHYRMIAKMEEDVKKIHRLQRLSAIKHENTSSKHEPSDMWWEICNIINKNNHHDGAMVYWNITGNELKQAINEWCKEKN